MTFTVGGMCRRTGQFGTALSTSSIGAGGRCPHVAPGLGLVVTQARTDPRLGPVGLDLLRAGRGAAETVSGIIASTPHSAWRQLGALTADGDSAVFTGGSCAQPADGLVLDDLADRLLQGIEDGEAAGGELDPLQSAALVVCDPAYTFPIVDLRIDNSPTPIGDLRRAWERWREIMEGYLLRAVDPAAAPDTRSLEGHA